MRPLGPQSAFAPRDYLANTAISIGAGIVGVLVCLTGMGISSMLGASFAEAEGVVEPVIIISYLVVATVTALSVSSSWSERRVVLLLAVVAFPILGYLVNRRYLAPDFND